MGANAENLQSVEQVSASKMGSILDGCYNKNQNNAERFAECFIEK